MVWAALLAAAVPFWFDAPRHFRAAISVSLDVPVALGHAGQKIAAAKPQRKSAPLWAGSPADSKQSCAGRAIGSGILGRRKPVQRVIGQGLAAGCVLMAGMLRNNGSFVSSICGRFAFDRIRRVMP
jgi:hypothetical protein